MTLLRFLIAAASLASAAMLTGCPGKSSQSNAAPHDAAYYNAHPQERQATLERCGKLDQSAQASDEDCKAALYSSLYGPSQLRPTATP
ncbi:MAG: EexN family lipoprotein [Vulcanimicrobiaceae bacterium]